METESKQKTRRGFKGSVLFTILVVMLVVLMLMVTTVGLASNASRRAYSEYFDHQTTSTARSVVDSVIYSLKSDNATLGASIVTQLQNNHSTPITVQVNGGNNLGEGFGTVDSLVFSYVGEDSAAGGFNITGSGKPIIRVTATVTQGGVTSSYSQYCIGETKSDNKTSSGGGLIALGGFEGAAQPGVDANSPAYFGVKNAFTYDKLVTLSNPNNGKLNSVVVNSSAEIKTSIPFMLGQKEGISVMGNLFVNDGTSKINTTESLADYSNRAETAKSGGSSLNQADNSYLYVGGTLYLHNNLELGMNSSPVNLYCGRIVTEANGNINGNTNIYCYNTGNDTPFYDKDSANAERYAKNPWSKLGTDNISKLLSWAESNVTPEAASYRNSALDTGSFSTMGNLELMKKVNISGDLYVKGNLNIHDINTGDSAIKGNAYIEGSVNDLTQLKSIVKGNIYTGTANVDGVSLAFDSSALPENVTSFLNGNLKLDSLKNSTVKTTDALKKQFYKEKKDTNGNVIGEYFTDAVNKSKLIIDGTTLVYSSPGSGSVEAQTMENIKAGNGVKETISSGSVNGYNYTVEITDSCILKGRFENVNIYINPSSEIWINIHNFNLANNANVIINDRNGRVNFFMPTDVTGDQVNVTAEYLDTYRNIAVKYPDSGVDYANGFRTDTEVYIMTLDYYNNFKNGSRIDLITYPTNDVDGSNVAIKSNDWMLPKVGFYAPENGNVVIRFTNNVLLTGDICAPGASFYSVSGCTSLTKFNSSPSELYYNGSKIQSGKVGCIGSIIVDKIKEFNNDYGMAYVDYPSSYNPGIGGGLQYEWTPIDGFADY